MFPLAANMPKLIKRKIVWPGKPSGRGFITRVV